MRRLIVILLVILFPLASFADGLDLPKTLASVIKRNPDKYVARIAALIVGYGTDGAIDRQGLENVIALARAKARAAAIFAMTMDDLNGDGTVSSDEIQLAAAVEAASVRGAMLVRFATVDGDGDGDGSLSAAEMRITADLSAIEGYDDQRANDLRAIMEFDADKDGRVNLQELRGAVTALDRAAAEKRIKTQVPQSPKAVSG